MMLPGGEQSAANRVHMYGSSSRIIKPFGKAENNHKRFHFCTVSPSISIRFVPVRPPRVLLVHAL